MLSLCGIGLSPVRCRTIIFASGAGGVGGGATPPPEEIFLDCEEPEPEAETVADVVERIVLRWGRLTREALARQERIVQRWGRLTRGARRLAHLRRWWGILGHWLREVRRRGQDRDHPLLG